MSSLAQSLYAKAFDTEMASRRNQGAAGRFMFLLPIGIVAAVAASLVLGPIAILALWIVNELRAVPTQRVARLGELLPDASERMTIARYRQLAASLAAARRETVRIGLGEDLLKRPSGLFEAKSEWQTERAQEINNALEQITRKHRDTDRSLKGLTRRIERRIERWVVARAAQFGARMGLIACLGAFLALAYVQPPWLAKVGYVIAKLGIAENPELYPLAGAAILSTMFGFCIGFLCDLTRRDALWSEVTGI